MDYYKSGRVEDMVLATKLTTRLVIGRITAWVQTISVTGLESVVWSMWDRMLKLRQFYYLGGTDCFEVIN